MESEIIITTSKENYAESGKSSRFATTSWSSVPRDIARGRQRQRQRHHRRYFRSRSLANVSTDGFASKDSRLTRERLLRTQPNPQPGLVKKFSRRQKLTLILLALVDFMSFCSMSIMAPFFPKEASAKGISNTISGFVFSFYALVMFLSAPVFGKFLPKVGAKFLFLAGMFIAGFSNLLFGLLEYINDYTMFTTFCLVVRGVGALGASAYSTASYVFVVNTFPNNIGTVIGILETFVGLGMSVGPAIGGLLYSLGGFGLPFYALGIFMVSGIPINLYLLPDSEVTEVEHQQCSIWSLIKVPAVVIIGLVVIIVSNTWGFLDPTLEPHLRQFNLTPEQIGLIFLLFSALYGFSSPGWGWLADKVNHHWSMMAIGLLFCTIGLLLLGPTPLMPFLSRALWLDMVALSILGVSVALALLPTFPGVLTSAIEGGLDDSLATYSLVAGVWSCMYSLGEVIGPFLGGIFLQNFGFPVATTIMAAVTFTLAVVTLIFFILKERNQDDYDEISDSGITSATSASWYSNSSSSSQDELNFENQPLLYDRNEHRNYTVEKVIYYEQSRRQDQEEGDHDSHQVTDVRGTVSITTSGACEV